MQGRRQKGVIFLIALTAMFAMGLALNGRLFRVRLLRSARRPRGDRQSRDGHPVLHRRVPSISGQGIVTAASYEYGNTFLIVSGLLNVLVAIDAYDVRLGRK